MFTLSEIGLLMLLPGLIGLVVSWLASSRAWPAALAIGGGVLLAGVLTTGVHGNPREAFDWLVLLPALALAVGIIVAWMPGVLGFVLVAGAGAINAWLLAVPKMSNADAVAAAAAPGVLYALLVWPARRKSGPPVSSPAISPSPYSDGEGTRGTSGDSSGAILAASWLMVAIATTCVSMASTGITFGKYSVALSAVMGGVFVAMLFRRKARLWPSGLAAFVLLWTSLLVYGYEWVDVPRWRVLVLLAAPLALWLGELPGLRGRPLLRVVICLTGVFALAATAAVPAALELLQTLRSQTQVGGY